MPKDETFLPATTLGRRPGVALRGLRWLFGLDGGEAVRRRGDLPDLHEELFRMRGELTLARAELEHVRSAVGRRDIATLEELLRAGHRREIEALIRDRTQTVPLPDGSVLCRVLGRFKMFTDAQDGAIAPHLLLDGYWEYWITEFVCRNVARGETAYDLGAIYGYYTVVLADLVGREGRVVAFEPNPWLHWLLQRNVAVNGSAPPVAVHRLAAAETPGDSQRVPVLLTGPFHGPFAGFFEFVEGRAVTTAPAVSLDGFEPGSVDFIKISSAGSAEAIWRGMRGLIGRSPHLRILLEFNAERCADAAGFVKELAERYPLRFVDGDSRAKPCTAEELLTRRRYATLFLSRLEPR